MVPTLVDSIKICLPCHILQLDCFGANKTEPSLVWENTQMQLPWSCATTTILLKEKSVWTKPGKVTLHWLLWQFVNPYFIPQNCACGTKFSVEHSFSCPKGGYPSFCHNKTCDLIASLLTEVCHEVKIEPTLLPVTSSFLFQIPMMVLN